MQINNIQSNQNFGMALKIKPEAVKALQNCSAEEIAKIRSIGEAMKEFKYVDLELDKFLEPSVINKAKNDVARYSYEPIRTEENKLVVMTRPSREEWGFKPQNYKQTTLIFDTELEAKKALETLSRKSGLDAAAEYANLMEKSEHHLAYLKQLQKTEHENVVADANRLVADFMA